MAFIETDPSLERNFKGHSDEVTSLSFSPTNEYLVSTSLDSTVMVWDLHSGNRSFRFSGHKDAAMDAGFSPDGELVASASRDRTVRLWDSSKNGIDQMKVHRAAVYSVCFTNDGKHLLTSSEDKVIKLWSLATKTAVLSFLGHKKGVRCTRISPLGNIIASCSEDCSIKLFDKRTGVCSHTFPEKNGYATKLTFHPTGTYIGTAMTNNCMKIYDIRTLKLLQQYNSHKKCVNDVAFHPSGRFLMSASDDGEMKVLDVLKGQPIYILQGHEVGTSVKAVGFMENGKYFASGGVDFMILYWRTNFDKETAQKGDAQCRVKERTSRNDSSRRIIVNTSLQQVKQSNLGAKKSTSTSQEFSCGDEIQQRKIVSTGAFQGVHTLSKTDQLQDIVKTLATDVNVLSKTVRGLAKSQKASEKLLKELANRVLID